MGDADQIQKLAESIQRHNAHPLEVLGSGTNLAKRSIQPIRQDDRAAGEIPSDLATTLDCDAI
jgi:hypothetical protein